MTSRNSAWERGIIAVLASVLVFILSVKSAEGAACCMSATIGGVGRLKIWEKWAVGLRNGFSSEIGFWNSKGEWSFHSKEYGSYVIRPQLWGLLGFGRRASAYALLPFVVNHKLIGKDREWGGGIGDIQAGFRYEFISIGEIQYIPSLALTFSLTFPTGRATEDSQSNLGADITGLGAWFAALSLSLEKTFYPWFIRADFGLKVPFPNYRKDLDKMQWYNLSLAAALIGGVELVRDTLVLGWSGNFNWRGEIYIDGEPSPDSSLYYFTLNLSVSWAFHSHWSLLLAGGTDLFVPQLGKNQNANYSLSLGIRYAYF